MDSHEICMSVKALIGMKKMITDWYNVLIYLKLLVDSIKIIVGIVSNILRFLVDGYTFSYIKLDKLEDLILCYAFDLTCV